MKKIIALLVVATLFAGTLFAQKSKLQTAWNFFKEPYQQYDKAKDAIDEAAVNEATMNQEKTWYYRGLIYHALYKDPKYGYLCDHCLETASESFMKAMQINPKNEWAQEIMTVHVALLMRDFFDRGIEEFKAKNFKDALNSFEIVQKLVPSDTSAILNSAYAAERAGNMEKAKQYYSRLISMNYRDDKMYISLSNIYRSQKDTARALMTIQDGRKIFPDTLNLILSEINILLATGRSKEASERLDEAIRKDPNNQGLYLALGSTYDNLANPKDALGKDLPKPMDYIDYLSKAEKAYLQGLVINTGNYELNYNLGALYFNQAAEMANAANNIKSTDDYNKAKEKFDRRFLESQPYLEKAKDFNPKKTDEDNVIYRGTLQSLKQLYARTNQTEKYNEVKVLLDK